jgi:hypothetical protein
MSWLVADVKDELYTGSGGPSTPSEQAAALAGSAQKKVGNYKTLSGMCLSLIYIDISAIYPSLLHHGMAIADVGT